MVNYYGAGDNPTQHGPEQPQQATGKPRRWQWIVAIVAAFLLGIGVGAGGSTGTDSDSTAESAAEEDTEAVADEPDFETESEPEPDPEPDGTVSGQCNSILGEARTDDRYQFVATLDVENTGGVDIEIEVWVEFSQIGADPVRFTDTVQVAVDETETVHVDERGNRDQWSRHNDSGRDCELGGDIVEVLE